MGVFLSLLRNPFFLLCGLFISALWYFYYRLASTIRQLKEAKAQLVSAVDEQRFLLSDFQAWVEKNRPDYPINDLDTIQNPEVSHRLLEKIIKERKSEDDPSLKAWHETIRSSLARIEEGEVNYGPLLEDYEQMLKVFLPMFWPGCSTCLLLRVSGKPRKNI
jgi:hypothetical protein